MHAPDGVQQQCMNRFVEKQIEKAKEYHFELLLALPFFI